MRENRSVLIAPRDQPIRLSLGGEAKTGAVGVKDNVLALQENVTEDGEVQAGVALDTAEAGGAAVLERSVVDQGAGNNGVVAANGDGEVGESGGAGDGVATSGGVLLSAGDLVVVVGDNVVGEQQEGGASVCIGKLLARA